MLSRILLVLLSLSLYSAGSSLSCRWVCVCVCVCANEDAEVDDTVSFPNHLYSQASKASAEDKVAFTVQILEEMVALLEGGYSSASWEENTEENFLSVVSRQAVGLRSCIGSHRESQRLHMYFKRLSHHVLMRMGHSAEAWELIRREMKSHLKRVDQLISSN
ncbi:interferon a3-like [Epinephelus fuscoguttatus]|uniref:interferon a3-like n=1 Tax=Epinephelus fuscoguttatus TaxID=293821 RepID=UPI0020D06523|nr:interferon a3-like [Epinephelus fuscoguttatus]